MKYTFNEWREKYNNLSFEEQVQYYNEIAKLYPEQAHYDLSFAFQVFDLVRPSHVTEAGGWKGDLAKIMLDKYNSIKFWENIEICEEAINNTKCTDIRFSNYIPDSFDWFDSNMYTDFFISTHFIEHLSNEDCDKLLSSLANVEYVYIESPLNNENQDWNNYFGTHKLNYGWDYIKFIINTHEVIKENNHCKLFKKK